MDAALPNPLPLPGAIKGFKKFEKGLLRTVTQDSLSKLGCIVDKPERFFEGDPVKALDWILKQYPDRSYEKLDAALPNPLPLPGAIKGFKKFEKGLLRTVTQDSLSTSP